MTDLFHGSDPNPPFEQADLQAALQASKARAWRRRSASVVPAAVLAGVGYLFAVSFVGGPAGTQDVTAFESAEVVLPANDAAIDIDRPVAVEPPSGPDAGASSAGRVTALQIDTDKVTVIADKPTSLIDVEPESDVTPVTPPAEESDTLETDSPDAVADVTSETSPATPLETASELSNESAVDTAASSSDEPIDEPTSAPAETQGSEGASAPGTDGVALPSPGQPIDLAETPDSPAATADRDASVATPADAVQTPAPAAAVSRPEANDTAAANDTAEVNDTAESNDTAEANDTAEVNETAVGVDSVSEGAVQGTDVSAGEADTTNVPAGDVETDSAVEDSIETIEEPVEREEVPVLVNQPVSVEFASMVIDGSSVEIVLQVSDVDGWSVGACGTSMNWGDGSSSGSMCAQDCSVAPDAAKNGSTVAPGVRGEIRFSHTYEATEGVVTPLFTIFTGHECFGDAFYGELNPSLVLSPEGIAFAS